ncbi:endothelial cell-specific molecule 1 [Ornithorhynchus anatinus]|uniref:Endothelial cell specific molecule 1 n=1 Tax=Ornithorhynchus anatinus TaxID=9258 RepID=A0A6I8PJS8_ORNAN|nr:endothelial cell-specific molecule 1 [Ornithorhynchus anatinus]
MNGVLLLTTFLVPVHLGVGRRANYAVDCPENCSRKECTGPQRCKKTVLDDCGCCRICAAGPGETCYRTVSGLDGAKCGPGLRCHFHEEEDDFGDEFGTCRECPFGSYGMECREICKCKSGLCDKVTGKCFTFFEETSKRRKPPSQTEHDMASGDGNPVKEKHAREKVARPPGLKWLNPR